MYKLVRHKSKWGESGFCCVDVMLLIEFLKLHNLEEDVLQDMFGISPVFIQVPRHTEYVPAFPYIELQVIICAFVGKLCQAHFLRGERFIQVKQVEHWGRKVSEGRRENSRPQLGKRGLKLRLYQLERLVFRMQLLVSTYDFRQSACRQLEQ